MKLWEPSADQVKNAQITAFIDHIEQQFALEFIDFQDFYDWTIREPEHFWKTVWDFCGIISSEPYSHVLDQGGEMVEAKWFPGARLNFAENLLRYNDQQTAIVFWGEDKVRRTLSYTQLHQQVAWLAAALKNMGTGVGDRVAGMLPNMPEAVIAMLATSSLGAVWSSCSPDFGTEGVVDRFGQIEPKVFLATDGYYHKGQVYETLETAGEVVQQIPSIEHFILCRYVNPAEATMPALRDNMSAHVFQTLIEPGSPPPLHFTQVPFDHPLYVLFSSGTTGKPKCIVHGVGGTLIEHLKEHILHTDLRRADNILYATTCGWMMWNWLVSGLAVGATISLYDGAPTMRKTKILFDMADKEEITVFGTSAAFISAIHKVRLRPTKTHQLKKLRAILSTGSPLVPENFDYVYEHVKKDLLLASISGGTDIIGCFVLGCPILPVYRGELQTRSLGYAVDVFDTEGNSLVDDKGELVCTQPFPSMPVCFWNDPDGVKYRAAYFSRYDNVWHHGDYVMINQRGGMSFFGRSDAVLNPGGIRIGTSEIYRQLEPIEEVVGSVVVGQEWKGDTRVVLFVKLAEDCELNHELHSRICTTIGTHATPRHVPKKIVQVADIPVTRSGKISELAVKDIIHGRPVQQTEALANPESLDEFRDLQEVQS
jgi:acetoacetyl-CoA synthetase